MDWQSPAALLVVAIVLGVFIYSIAKSKGKSGCSKCGGCAPPRDLRSGK